MRYLVYLTERIEYLQKLVNGDPTQLSKYLHNHLTPHQIKVLKILPSRKDDGCYVYFADAKQAEIAYKLLEKKNRYNVFLVEGSPFLEDLLVKPTNKLILMINTTKKKTLTEEEVYHLCRPYGKIREIEITPGKIIVDFKQISSAIAARNCLHRKAYLDGIIKLKYLKTEIISKDWLHFSKHPYFYIILILILLLLFLEPMRLYSVTHTIEKDCNGHDLKTLPGYNVRDVDIEHIIETLALEHVILLSSPPGSASGILVQRLRESYPLAVWVHCATGLPGTPLLENLLEGIASSIGYRPSYNLVHNIITAIGSILGAKVEGVVASTSKEAQLDGVLSTLTNALKILAIKRSSHFRRKPIVIFQDIHLLLDQEASTEEKTKFHALLKNILYWSHRVALRQGVRVIFVVNTLSLEQLFTAVPKFREVSIYYLKDLSKEQTRAILLEDTISKDGKIEVNKFALSMSDEDFETMWDIVGGRPHDLLLIKKQAKRGKNIADIARSMLLNQKQHVLANGFGMTDELTTPDGKWSKIQFWRVIKLLNENKNGGVSFNALVRACGGDSASAVAMCRKGWVIMESNQYMAASPLMAAAYESILTDPALQNIIDNHQIN